MPIFLDLFLGIPRYTIYFFQDILLGGSGYPFQVLAPFRWRYMVLWAFHFYP
jgi:hypothetical protein